MHLTPLQLLMFRLALISAHTVKRCYALCCFSIAVLSLVLYNKSIWIQLLGKKQNLSSQFQLCLFHASSGENQPKWQNTSLLQDFFGEKAPVGSLWRGWLHRKVSSIKELVMAFRHEWASITATCGQREQSVQPFSYHTQGTQLLFNFHFLQVVKGWLATGTTPDSATSATARSSLSLLLEVLFSPLGSGYEPFTQLKACSPKALFFPSHSC